MGKNKIKIKICNSSFTVSGEDDVEYTLSLAAEVDREVHEIMTSSSRISVTDAALITALNYCDSCKKSEKTIDALRRKNRDYLDSAARIRLQADEYRREVIKLEHENQMLKQRLFKFSPSHTGTQPLSAPIRKTESSVELEEEEAAED